MTKNTQESRNDANINKTNESEIDFRAIDAQTQSVYQNYAQQYDSRRDKSLFEREYLDKVLQQLDQSPKVLDLGCGAGEPIARYLIEKGCLVTGIDYASNMIKLCQERFPNHTWQVDDMRDLKVQDKFDAILSWGAFFHLTQDQQRQALPGICRRLNNNGVILITVGHADGEVTGTVAKQKVYHSSLSQQEYTSILENEGLQIIEFTLNDPNCNGFSVFLAKRNSTI